MVGKPDKTLPDSVYGFQLGFAKSKYLEEKEVYHPPQSQNIPQVDGGLENVDREWWCYCCEYAKLFDTEELLHQHHDDPEHFVTYEECNICYPWHVWT